MSRIRILAGAIGIVLILSTSESLEPYCYILPAVGMALALIACKTAKTTERE